MSIIKEDNGLISGGKLLDITPNSKITSTVKAAAVQGTCFAYGEVTINTQVNAGETLFSGLAPAASSITIYNGMTYPTNAAGTAVRNIIIDTSGNAVIPTGGTLASGNTWHFAIGYDY